MSGVVRGGDIFSKYTTATNNFDYIGRRGKMRL